MIAADDVAFLVLAQPVTQGIVARRLLVEGRRLVAANLPPLRHHSADGFDFGGQDGGSADLALAAVQMVLNRLDYLGPTRRLADGSHVAVLAWQLHGKFCAEFVAGAAGDDLVIAWRRVMAWVRQEMLAYLWKEKITLQGVLDRWRAVEEELPALSPRNGLDQLDVLHELYGDVKDLCGSVGVLSHFLGMQG